MKRLYPFIVVVLCSLLLTFPAIARGQDKVPVKVVTQIAQNDFVAKRLLYFINQGIKSSDKLKPAEEESAIIIFEILAVKVPNRPSTAYSYIIYANNYGKISPVMDHRLGICSNLTAKKVAVKILEDLQKDAGKFEEQLKNSGG